MYKIWTKDEIKQLKEMSPYKTDEDISKILNRPVANIKKKRQRLGIKKEGNRWGSKLA